MERKKTLAVGLAALLVFGLVVAVNAATEAAEEEGCMGFPNGLKMGGRHGMDKTALLEDLGLSEDATREDIRDALWEKRLSDLGLTEDSTVGEYRQAMQARMQERQQERLHNMREKLGLSEDATEDEIHEALKQWRQENQDLLGGRGRGFNRGHRWLS